MTFETKEKDILGRIGKLKTKSGTIETPALLPVVNPVTQPVPPKRMRQEFGFEALITNAYILKQSFHDRPVEEGLHKFLDFNGTIMTDSGAYQTLVYGGVRTNPKEIVSYQEQIDTDVATILDIPTGWKVTEERAKRTVEETLKRARDLFETKMRDDILWVGPIQGGKYLNLVAKSAQQMDKLSFDINALGSPTEVMERYRFDILAEMIIAAKMNLHSEKPLHLFGAGHPFMFTLAVALGCDLFDSAAYALYARENRYMTEDGTYRLDELAYFPCNCPRCSRSTPKQALELEQEQRIIFLAEHNLYACCAEIKRIKQSIRDGRLWEHLEMRAHSHPALLQALKTLAKHEEFIEKHSPATKKSGLFSFNFISLIRPEVVHYRRTLKQRYAQPDGTTTLLLFPQAKTKPFHKSQEYKRAVRVLKHQSRAGKQSHTCFYAAPFGVIPVELDEVYPLSQHDVVLPLDRETVAYVAHEMVEYIDRTSYKKVILIENKDTWGKTLETLCKRACVRRRISFETFSLEKALSTMIPTAE
jgi:7-cyano-7-deazaguanine tRNA-ribosyltransferase